MAGYYLTSEERLKIELKRRQVRDKRQHVRLSVLVMLDEGFTQQDIAISQGIDLSSVGNYKRKYEQNKNLDHYISDAYVPYTGLLFEQELLQVEHWLEQNTCLRARQAGDYIFEQFKVDYTDSATAKLLHSLGYVYKKVKPVPGKADEQAQQAFVKKLEQLRQQPDTVIYFADATHPTHNTQPHYAWIKQGEERQIAANAGRQRLNLHGAVSVAEEVVTVVEDAAQVNSESVISLFTALLEQEKRKQVIVICDNARYYHSQKVKEWLQEHPRLRQEFLPAYSPNLNLIERLWKWVNEKVIAPVYYPTFPEFRKAVLELFDQLPDYQEELKSRLTFNFEIIKSPLA
jgi:transposase